ncbi:hypothetical protein R1sor_010127 [Riccia sorocarpa]|uniref:Reverse transcriptase zinc-binding domain-containing protein n=1 Tax=Riccia sorocarpa TaxID=122646 RepID=A0ABD3HYP4_9MARC
MHLQEDNLKSMLRVLDKVHTALQPAQRAFLDEDSSDQEIQEVAGLLPKNKAPGSDAFSADALMEGWSFFGRSVQLFIHHAWATRLIPFSFLGSDYSFQVGDARNRLSLSLGLLGFFTGLETAAPFAIYQDWPVRAVVSRLYSDMFRVKQEVVTCYINAKWSIPNTQSFWTQLWKILFSNLFSLSEGLWVWRLATHAFFTVARAKVMCLSNTACMFCGHPDKTVQHIFYNCTRWAHLCSSVLLSFPLLYRLSADDPFSVFLPAFENASTYLTARFLIHYWKYIWRLRCQYKYETKLARPSPFHPQLTLLEQLLVDRRRIPSAETIVTQALRLLLSKMPPQIRTMYIGYPFGLTA